MHMRRVLMLLGVATATVLASWLTWHYGVVGIPYNLLTLQTSTPQDGKVQGGSYVNDYFGLSFPLPEEWAEGDPGPDPSDAGYYVLRSLIPKSELNATILISAQDLFFASKRYGDMAEMARDFRHSMAEVDGMTIDREPTEVKVEDRLLHRVDFSGVGLYRATFTTEIRCHALSFNLTARSPDLLENLAVSIGRLSASGNQASFPHCIENYAVPDNLLKRVEPVPVGAKFVPIPVRIIIDTAGGVRHVHVIRASDEQRRNIEYALNQWKFKPYQLNGRAVEIETGLLFRFAGAKN
jgi:hypothetical protein